MILFLNDVLMSFRSCFKRRAAFEWFVITIIGFMVRNDSLGITSIVRELAIKPELYTTYLHYFRSTAWNIQSLTRHWTALVGRHAPVVKVNNMVILIGDGLTACSEGRRTPGVYKHHQESENSGKAEWVWGHLFGLVGVLVGNPEQKLFCMALTASVQVGVSQLRKLANDQINIGSHVVQVVRQAGNVATQLGAAVVVLDRYFLSTPALQQAKQCIENNQQILQVVTKAKKCIRAYTDPPPYSGRGRPRVKGDSVKLVDLFTTRRADFIKVTLNLYGKPHELEYFCTDLLWGKKLYQKLRFVLVSYDGTLSILASTSLELSPIQIITLYGCRFKIEVGFKELKHTIGAFYYHFWSKYMPKLNRYNKQFVSDALEQISDPRIIEMIVGAFKAIEGYVLMAIISMGLLQMLSLKFSHDSTLPSFRWLRTRTSTIVSEGTVAYDFPETHFSHY